MTILQFTDDEIEELRESAYIAQTFRLKEKEFFAKEIAEQLEDDHSLGFYRKVVDIMPEHLIFQALSEVKDAFLSGRVKKSKAALFTTIIKSKASKHNINLNI